MIKAMYFRFIVLLIVAQTRVYTNTDHFCQIFLLLFIYCKRAGWKYSPLMAKWERGSKVREEGQQVVWWRLYKHKKNGTGQVHKMKWFISQRGADEERLCPARTVPGSMIGFTPLTIQFRIWWRGCTNPCTVLGTDVYRRDKWFRVVKKGEKVKGPVVASSTPAAVPCKAQWQKASCTQTWLPGQRLKG